MRIVIFTGGILLLALATTKEEETYLFARQLKARSWQPLQTDTGIYLCTS
jgi:hypothetical protein